MNNNFPTNREKDTANNTDQRIKEFQDTDGLSINKLNFGLWYVEHIKYLRLTGVIILIIISIVSWLYTFYGFAHYYIRGVNEDKVIMKQLLETKIIDHSYLAQSVNKDLIIYPAQVLQASNKKYDLLVQVKNTNSKLYGEFNYYFLVNGQKTKQQSGFILPDESKYLFVLAQEFSYQPSDIQLVVENLKWSRLNRKITNWQDYYNTHLNIIDSDIKFIPASQSELLQNQLSYNSYNKTPYNYWSVDYLILLFSGNAVINIEKYTLANFMSGQVRLVQLNWPGNIGRVDEVKIIPEINITDQNIYIKYEGENRSGDQSQR